MHFIHAIAVVIAGIFTNAMADALMRIIPLVHTAIDVRLLRVHTRARGKRRGNDLVMARGTFANIRMTTSPPRGMIPTSGGFSVASVPRSRWPLSRLRRPRRPFV